MNSLNEASFCCVVFAWQLCVWLKLWLIPLYCFLCCCVNPHWMRSSIKHTSVSGPLWNIRSTFHSSLHPSYELYFFFFKENRVSNLLILTWSLQQPRQPATSGKAHYVIEVTAAWHHQLGSLRCPCGIQSGWQTFGWLHKIVWESF